MKYLLSSNFKSLGIMPFIFTLELNINSIIQVSFILEETNISRDIKKNLIILLWAVIFSYQYRVTDENYRLCSYRVHLLKTQRRTHIASDSCEI